MQFTWALMHSIQLGGGGGRQWGRRGAGKGLCLFTLELDSCEVDRVSFNQRERERQRETDSERERETEVVI